MMTELESAKYYHEPSAEELALADKQARSATGRLRSSFRTVCLLFWIVFFVGSGYVAYHALCRANQVAKSSAGGGAPAMSMLSYVMNLVDFDWDRTVEQRVRKNRSAAQRDVPTGPIDPSGNSPY